VELGRGLRYREMMVIPLENCSRNGFRSDEELERNMVDLPTYLRAEYRE
jgi:hypothetical protein